MLLSITSIFLVVSGLVVALVAIVLLIKDIKGKTYVKV